MPTTMPAAESVINWDFMSALLGAVIGGIFSLAGTWLTLRHQLKSIRVQETTRLRWTKRWEVIGETYSLLAKTYLALRRMLYPQSPNEAKHTIEVTRTALREFDAYLFEYALFLPKEFDSRIRAMGEELGVIARDLSNYSKALFSENLEAGNEQRFWREYEHKHRDSLVGGEMERQIEQLKDDLRKYLDR